ncbi:MAG: mercuric reductase [Gemmatimonadota bacterium]|nr:mercuric reductase [Gemmatimonadota bacterium]
MSAAPIRFDVIIVGAGQAGVPLAARFAEAGRRVALIERAHVGGTCVNYGCTPTKTMVASARAAHMVRTAGRLGVHVGDVQVDLAAVVERKNRIVTEWRAGVERRLERAGDRLTLVRGNARFVGERLIGVNGTRYTADTIVLNVGARPATPNVPGLDRVPTLDSTGIMELRALPEHLIVLGGGYIGCEFGQMFRRFGAPVTIVHRGQHLLDREDSDVSVAIEDVFRREGIDLRLGVSASTASADQGGVRLQLTDGTAVTGSHALVAVGRVPNTGDLGCAAANIALDRRGFVTVDDAYRTSAAGVYAVGDVTGGPQFTHTSWDDHRILFDRLTRDGDGSPARTRAGRLIPYCVFTDPQVARVGLSEREAADRGIACEVASMPFGAIARASELDETAGLLKVLLDPATERVLGAAIVGIEAGELIHIFSTLMQAGASPRAIVDAQAVHPTLAEGVQSLVMRLDRFALT